MLSSLTISHQIGKRVKLTSLTRLFAFECKLLRLGFMLLLICASWFRNRNMRLFLLGLAVLEALFVSFLYLLS